jgi:Fic family protein
MTGRARRLRYERAEWLSLQQAQRNLRDLVSTGILEPVGQTRARYYKEGPASRRRH